MRGSSVHNQRIERCLVDVWKDVRTRRTTQMVQFGATYQEFKEGICIQGREIWTNIAKPSVTVLLGLVKYHRLSYLSCTICI